MSICKSCGAEIKWIRTFSGKAMPVDANPIYFSEGGNGIFVTDNGAVIHGTECPKGQMNARVGYISHFVTCPNAGQHRRKSMKAGEEKNDTE